MRTISIAGRVGKDAVTRQTNDTSVTGFSVAVDQGWGDKKTTLWFDCSMWGQRGDKVAQYVTKGTPVSASGEFGTREHEGKTYLTIRVAELTLQGKREDDERPRRASHDDNPPGPPAQGADFDSIPFAPEFR